MAKITQDELNKLLWNAADSTRGTVDGGMFKDYILAFLFYKYMSDIKQAEAKKLQERYGNDKERIELRLKNARFVLPEGASFYDIYEQQNADNIGELINKALRKIEDANESHLKGIFTVDFNSEAILGQTNQRNKMIRDLITDFNKVDLSDVEGDLLGNAYMYLIERFGSDAGKKAGEFYTPKVLSSLLAKLAQPKPGDRICDPACGSGGLLLLAGEEVSSQGSKNYALYGQEKTGATYNLARMNMFLHNINYDKFNIALGNTLMDPQFGDDKPFDAIVSNPPYSVNWIGSDDPTLINDDRFAPAGVLAPKSKADFAFVLHALSYLSSKGRAAIVCFPGIFYRGGAEQKIRKYLVDNNFVETVIALAPNLFYGTTIAVNILVLSKHKMDTKTQFIDATGNDFFRKETNNNVLDEKHIKKILEIFDSKEDIEAITKSIDNKLIAENDYNLSVSSYVEAKEARQETNIKELNDRIRKIVARENELRTEINKIIAELEEDEL